MKENDLDLLDQIHIRILEVEFEKRKAKDKKYSIRKYAQDVDIDASTMSQYLRGKRKLTPYSFNTILTKLRVDNDVIEKYEKDRLALDQLKEKHFLVKSHWYYFAILELTYLYDCSSDHKWISQRLDLDIKTVDEAVQNLIDIGAMEKNGDKYIDTLGNITFIDDPNMDNEAGRTYQKQLIEKAVFSIDHLEGDIKDHTSSCFAFDSSLTPEVKHKIEVFREELAHFIEANSKSKDAVYSLQINLHKLTK